MKLLSYRFEVAMCVALCVNETDGGDDLAEEYTSLVFGQTIFLHDVVK